MNIFKWGGGAGRWPVKKDISGFLFLPLFSQKEPYRRLTKV